MPKLYSQPPPLQLTFFPQGSTRPGFRQVSARFCRVPPGSSPGFRRVPPSSTGFRWAFARSIPPGCAGFLWVPLGSAAPPGSARFRWVRGSRQVNSAGLCRVLPGFRQQGSCSCFNLLPGLCQVLVRRPPRLRQSKKRFLQLPRHCPSQLMGKITNIDGFPGGVANLFFWDPMQRGMRY